MVDYKADNEKRREYKASWYQANKKRINARVVERYNTDSEFRQKRLERGKIAGLSEEYRMYQKMYRLGLVPNTKPWRLTHEEKVISD